MTRYRRKVYLDYNATCPTGRESLRQVEHALRSLPANASAAYSGAARTREAIESAREQVARSIQVRPDEVFFTSGASESNNAILKGLFAFFEGKKKTIVSSPIEHPSVMLTLDYLEKQGARILYCKVDSKGFVDMRDLEAKIDPDCFLVCCMLANNELGTIQDLASVSDLCRKKQVLLFSDCVQAAGKIPVRLTELGVDYASFSSHKIYGPKGCGAMFIRKGVPFIPFIHGGSQEDGWRAGTEATHNIIGYGAACDAIDKYLDTSIGKLERCKRFFIQELKRIKPDVIINSPEKNCLPNTINLSIPGINSYEFLAMLDYYGIAVSVGSACSVRERKPSHVLLAIGLTDKQALETIRISLGRGTSMKDIRYTLKIMRSYFKGEIARVKMIDAKELSNDLLNDTDNIFLDVRPGFLRRRIEGIPGARAGSITGLRKLKRTLPGDKDIYIICQTGNFSYIASYYLTSRGMKRVINVRDGIQGWLLSQRNS